MIVAGIVARMYLRVKSFDLNKLLQPHIIYRLKKNCFHIKTCGTLTSLMY